MWNLRSLKISVMLVASGVALVAALPAKAQQVILTPAGTMFQPTMMPGTEMGGGQPVPAPIALDPSLPSYDILTPEQLKPGKIIFRGNLIEILAPDDPRISEQRRLGQPPDTVGVFWEATMMGASYQPRSLFLAPPVTNVMPTWDGNLRVGTKVPGFAWSSENVIVANDDPRIPENLRAMDLGDFYYWAIDSRALNPALPPDLFSPHLYSRDQGFMSPGIAATDVRPEAVRAGIEQYQRELAWRNPPPDDPIDPDPLIGGPGGVRYSELIKGDKPDSSRAYTPEELAEAYRRGELFYPHGSSAPQAVVSPSDFYKDLMPGITLGSGTGTGLIDDGMYGARPYTGIVQILDENTSRILTPEEVALFNQRYIKPYNPNAVNPLSQSLPSIQPTVTVQASQNPAADFATTRSAPRNTVPEQLNRGVVDSPLSNSRIFPGMR
jgi:hypothetical protein